MAFRPPTKGADGKFRGSPGRPAPSGGGGSGGSGGSGGTTITPAPTPTATPTQEEFSKQAQQVLAKKILQKQGSDLPAEQRASLQKLAGQPSRTTIRRVSGGGSGFTSQQAQQVLAKKILQKQGSDLPAEQRASLQKLAGQTRTPIRRIERLSTGGKTLTELGTIPRRTTEIRELPSEKRTVTAIREKKKPFIGFEDGALRIGRGKQLEFLTDEQAQAKKGELALLAFPFFRPLTKAKKAKVLFQAGKKQILSTGKKGITVIKSTAEQIAKSKAAKTAAKISKTRTAKFLKDIGLTSVKGVAIVEGAKLGGKVTAPKEERKVTFTKGFKDIVSKGFTEETKAVRQQGLIQSIGFEISPFISTQKATFEKTVREQFKQQGLTGAELKTAVSAAKRQRTAASIGEAGSLLEISRSSERIGRKGVVFAFEAAKKKLKQIPKKKAGGILFKKTFIPIGKAGIVEGVASEVTQEFSRGQPISPKKIATTGALGGVSAGLIGGAIVGTKINLPKLSKTLELGSFVTDPFEKPGDILADISEKAAVKIFKRTPSKVPTITQPIKPGELIDIGTKGIKPVVVKAPSLSQTLQFGKPVKPVKKVGKSLFKIQTLPFIKTPIKAPVSVTTGKKTPSIVPTPTLTNILQKGKSKTPIPIPPSTPVKTDILSPIITPVTIPTAPTIPAETPINVQTPTNVPVGIPINIPSRTPQLRVPPPIPLAIPFGSGQGVVVKGKRTKFVKESEIAKQLFQGFAGVPFKIKKPKAIKSKKKKGKGKKKQKPVQFDLSKLIFG